MTNVEFSNPKNFFSLFGKQRKEAKSTVYVLCFPKLALVGLQFTRKKTPSSIRAENEVRIKQPSSYGSEQLNFEVETKHIDWSERTMDGKRGVLLTHHPAKCHFYQAIFDQLKISESTSSHVKFFGRSRVTVRENFDRKQTRRGPDRTLVQVILIILSSMLRVILH